MMCQAAHCGTWGCRLMTCSLCPPKAGTGRPKSVPGQRRGGGPGPGKYFLPPRASSPLKPGALPHASLRPLSTQLVGREVRLEWLQCFLSLPCRQSLRRPTSSGCFKWKEDAHLPFSAALPAMGSLEAEPAFGVLL